MVKEREARLALPNLEVQTNPNGSKCVQLIPKLGWTRSHLPHGHMAANWLTLRGDLKSFDDEIHENSWPQATNLVPTQQCCALWLAAIQTCSLFMCYTVLLAIRGKAPGTRTLISSKKNVQNRFPVGFHAIFRDTAVVIFVLGSLELSWLKIRQEARSLGNVKCPRKHWYKSPPLVFSVRGRHLFMCHPCTVRVHHWAITAIILVPTDLQLPLKMSQSHTGLADFVGILFYICVCI